MGLCDVPLVHTACGIVGGATKAVAGSAFQAVVDAFAKGLADIMKALMTFWIHAPDPDLSRSSVVINTLDHLTRPLVAFGALIGLIVGGVRLVWTARHEQPAQAIFRGLFLMVIVTGAGATLVDVALTGFDQLATAILDDGFNGKSVGEQLLLLGRLPGVGGGLVFVLAFFGMLASLVQVGIMLVRGGILAVLVGVLPIAAGAAITDAGFSWFKRLAGWILSFTVYKLTAAVIYAAAFLLIGSSKDLAGIVSGYSLIILAILALPALLRLLPPSTEAMGGGGGGGLAAAGAAVATGAMMLAGHGTAGAAPLATAVPGLKGGGGSGGGGPSGANGTSGGGGSGGSPALAGAAPARGGSGSESGAGSGGGGPAGGGLPTAGGGGAAAGAAAGGAVGTAVLVAQRVQAAGQAAAEGAAGDGASR